MRQYARYQHPVTSAYSVAEAVTTSLTEDTSYGDHDGALERLGRQIDAQARAIGELAQLCAALAPAGMSEAVDNALAEILSSRFRPYTGTSITADA